MKLAPKKSPFTITLGERGEMVAWSFLQKKGFRLIEKNYRCKIGEVDVIAKKNSTLHFIEIKTRTSDQFGHPSEAVGLVKQRKLVKLAQWYLKVKKIEDMKLAFSVVAVIWPDGLDPQIELIEDAFEVDTPFI